MYKHLFFIVLYFVSNHTSIYAQADCDARMEKVGKLLKTPSPYTDPNKIFDMVFKCTQQGHAKAENYMGMFYLKGIHVKKDTAKAFTYIAKSANQGFAKAQFNLGRFYKEGIGCKINFDKALTWFTKATSNGNQHAAYILGYMHFKGFGVPQNYNKATYWFRRSNYPMAKHFLGLCYYYGYGVKANEAKALEILMGNAISNSKNLVHAIRIEQKQKEAQKANQALLSKTNKNFPVNKALALKTHNEIQYYPEESLENEDLKGIWTGKLIQYDWSGKHIMRVFPVRMNIALNQKTNKLNVVYNLNGVKLNTTAQWQDDVLYFEKLNQALEVPKLYYDHPKKLNLAYNLLSTSLQKYNHQGTEYLIGGLDTFIPEWREYGSPMSLILKPVGTADTLSEEALLSLAEQKDQFIKLYPVPFKNHLTVQYQLEKASFVTVTLVSLHGNKRILIQPRVYKEAGDYTHSIAVDSGLPKGIYVVRVNAGNQLHTRTIIKD